VFAKQNQVLNNYLTSILSLPWLSTPAKPGLCLGMWPIVTRLTAILVEHFKLGQRANSPCPRTRHAPNVVVHISDPQVLFLASVSQTKLDDSIDIRESFQ
jgi:hypothetical protein